MKKISFAIMALLSASAVNAACLPSDITGNWVMYQTNINAQPQHTGRCDIKIADDATRTLTGTCNLSMGANLVVTGTAKVNTDCSAAMTMNFTGGSMTFGMQLTPDRQSFAGRWKNSFGNVGGTNGVRK